MRTLASSCGHRPATAAPARPKTMGGASGFHSIEGRFHTSEINNALARRFLTGFFFLPCEIGEILLQRAELKWIEGALFDAGGSPRWERRSLVRASLASVLSWQEPNWPSPDARRAPREAEGAGEGRERSSGRPRLKARFPARELSSEPLIPP